MWTPCVFFQCTRICEWQQNKTLFLADVRIQEYTRKAPGMYQFGDRATHVLQFQFSFELSGEMMMHIRNVLNGGLCPRNSSNGCKFYGLRFKNSVTSPTLTCHHFVEHCLSRRTRRHLRTTPGRMSGGYDIAHDACAIFLDHKPDLFASKKPDARTSNQFTTNEETKQH